MQLITAEALATLHDVIGMWRYKREGDWDKRVDEGRNALAHIEQRLAAYERVVEAAQEFTKISVPRHMAVYEDEYVERLADALAALKEQA